MTKWHYWRMKSRHPSQIVQTVFTILCDLTEPDYLMMRFIIAIPVCPGDACNELLASVALSEYRAARTRWRYNCQNSSLLPVKRGLTPSIFTHKALHPTGLRQEARADGEDSCSLWGWWRSFLLHALQKRAALCVSSQSNRAAFSSLFCWQPVASRRSETGEAWSNRSERRTDRARQRPPSSPG